jgi:Fibronectin type III domain
MKALGRTLAALLGALPVLGACSSTPAPLTAELISPNDITLTWTTDAQGEPDAAGWIVEFATEREGRYTILDFVPRRQTTFTHPDLMPETRFYYRIRPYYGPSTVPKVAAVDEEAVTFTWPDNASDEDGYLLELKPSGASVFDVVAYLDPGTESFTLYPLPRERNAAARVRAFYDGPPSNTATQTTGTED